MHCVLQFGLHQIGSAVLTEGSTDLQLRLRFLMSKDLRVGQSLQRAFVLPNSKGEVSEHNDPVNDSMRPRPFSLKLSEDFNFSCTSQLQLLATCQLMTKKTTSSSAGRAIVNQSQDKGLCTSQVAI